MTRLSQIAPGVSVNFNNDSLVGVQSGNDARITPAQLFASFPPLPTAFTGSIIATVRSSSAATVTITGSDYFLALDPTSNAITVNLPSAPQTGLTFLIKDATGQSSAHNITVVPASGTIDGAANFVLNNNFESIAVTYNGTQWSIN